MNSRALLIALCLATSLRAAPLDDAQSQLQRQRYTEAITTLSDAVIASAPQPDYARYLRAVAEAAASKPSECLTDCDAVPTSSTWFRKARFLKAESLAALKQHEQAEAIYREEATRLFASTRSDQLASALVDLAKDLTKSATPGQTVSTTVQQHALALYRKALEADAGAALRESLQRQIITLLESMHDQNALIAACDAYLRNYDPAWPGLIGQRTAGKAAANPKAVRNDNRSNIRLTLIRAMIAQDNVLAARSYADELQALWKIAPKEAGDAGELDWLVCLSRASDQAQFITRLRAFLTAHPSEPRSAEATQRLGEALAISQKHEEAIALLTSFIARKDFPLPKLEDPNDKRLPKDVLADWQQRAVFAVASLRFKQRRYTDAIAQWRAYIAQYPEGVLWQQAQASIADTEFQLALEPVSKSDFAEAKKRFESFIAAHPLDARCTQLIFLTGQWELPEKIDAASATKAITAWASLITKYPQSEEASYSLYRTGVLQAEVLDQHEAALASFQRLTWGQWKALAAERAALMPQKSLALSTQRIFRSNEVPSVHLSVRNIETLKFTRYTLSLEDYFRSRHRITGAAGVESLDIDLIQPDATWEVKVANYQRLKPFVIDQPINNGDKPVSAVNIVRVEGEDWQASTIVIRSDIDLIVESAWKESLVFVQDRLKNTVVADAEVLLSNGKEIIATGRTGADGVYRFKGDAVQASADLCAYVRSPAGEAIQRLDLRGMTQEITGGSTNAKEVATTRRGYLYTDRNSYRPGDDVHFRGIIRDVQYNDFIVPSGREYEITVQESPKRILLHRKLKLSERGSFTDSFPLPAQMPFGRYEIIARCAETSEVHRANFSVEEVQREEITATLTGEPKALFASDRLKLTFTAKYSWGSALADELVRITMPDGRLIEARTDKDGHVFAEQDTSAFQPSNYLHATAQLPARHCPAAQYVQAILTSGASVQITRLPSPALAGEAALIRVKTLDHEGKPFAREVKLTLKGFAPPKPNAVLASLPLLHYIADEPLPTAEQTITVKTDAMTGIGEAKPVLAIAGNYSVEAETTDDHKNLARATHSFEVKGDDDPVKLRLFSDQSEVAEGANVKVDAHSRQAVTLALMTLSGETFIEHRIMQISTGHNTVNIDTNSAHWPHFTVSVAYLSDKLHQTSRGFTIERPLSIEITGAEKSAGTGEARELTLITKDAQGKPVAAELSLSLGSEAMLAHYGQSGLPITEYFTDSLRTHGSVHTSTTAGFAHHALSRVQGRDSSGAASGLAQVQASQLELIKQLEAKERGAWGGVNANMYAGQSVALRSDASAQGVVLASNLVGNGGGLTYANSFNGRSITSGNTLTVGNSYSGTTVINGGTFVVNQGSTVGSLALSGNAATGFPITPTTPMAFENDNDQIAPDAIDGLLRDIPLLGRIFGGPANQAFTFDSQWHCPLVTDATGKTTLKLTTPAQPGVWRLHAKGITCAKPTLTGQQSAKLTTVRPLMVELKVPSLVREGDSVVPTAVVHLAKDQQATKAKLTLRNGDAALEAQDVELKPGEPTTITLTKILAKERLASLSLQMEAGDLNAIANRVMVIESLTPAVATTTGAIGLGGKATLTLEPRKPASDHTLHFIVHDSPRSLLSSMARDASSSGQTPASHLLSAVSAFVATPKNEALAQQIRLLISTLQITQHDGGWAWEGLDAPPDSIVTSLGFWSFIEAKRLGFDVDASALKSASACLKRILAILPPDEPDKAAVILHALALNNEADFSMANRLFRDRDKLNAPAQAFLAAAFLSMERKTEADQLLALLAKPLLKAPLQFGSTSTQRLSQANDVIAIVLWASAKAGNEELSRQFADMLVSALGLDHGRRSPLQGLWTAALLEHFRSQLDVPAAKAFSIASNGKAAEFTPKGKPHFGQLMQTVLHFDAGKAADMTLSGDATTLPIIVALDEANLGNVLQERKMGMEKIDGLPQITSRHHYHDTLSHKAKPLQTASTSPVKEAENGQRIRAELEVKNPDPANTRYVIIDEPIPAGCFVVADSVQSNAKRMDILPGLLRLWFRPGSVDNIRYELIAQHTGSYRVPSTQVRDACDPLRRIDSKNETKLTILAPDQRSSDKYEVNAREHYELADLLFNEGANNEALTHLTALRTDAEAMKAHEQDISRMMLWIHTQRTPMDARAVVELFEALSERHPQVVIPFDKILKVAQAYTTIGEHERAWLVYRATIEGSFVRDASLSAALANAGDFPGSAAHQLALTNEYPDGDDVLLASFTLAQSFQDKANDAAMVPVRPGATKLTKDGMLKRAQELLTNFITLHAKDHNADDAAFSLANVDFDRKDYSAVVRTAESAAQTFTKSTLNNSFHYMAALGHFWQYQFPEAIAAAAPVAVGNSNDAGNARYITAQVHHAEGHIADAIQWYSKVKGEFADAADSITLLQEKQVVLPRATSLRSGQPVRIELKYRNVKEAALKVYRVDLMKLYERQKDLSSVTSVNLAGITPESELTVPLGQGQDLTMQTKPIDLPMKTEGAYLIICRGDSVITSSLVLITPLELDVNEGPGDVRIAVRDTAKSGYLADADIAIYDSANATAQKGRTDPRGSFSGSASGYATVIVKHGDARYAFYRSAAPLTQALLTPAPAPQAQRPATAPARKAVGKDLYLNNLRVQQQGNFNLNNASWDEKVKGEGKGVQGGKAFKK